MRLRGEGVRPGPGAHRGAAEERARSGRGWSTLYADFDKYQRWTDREIPVVVLEPR